MTSRDTFVPLIAAAGAGVALYAIAPFLVACSVGAGVLLLGMRYWDTASTWWQIFATFSTAGPLGVAASAPPPRAILPRSVEDVQLELRHAGLEMCQLVVGVDFTKSNTWTGKRTFGGNSLHALLPNALNPYQSVIQSIGETLAVFDDDGQIPVFGDKRTTDQSVFALSAREDAPELPGFAAVLDCYTAVTPTITLDGPTSYAPLIYRAMEHVRSGPKSTFTILLIITDGAVTNEEETREAIVAAAELPMSIIVIGVGDGPWDLMHQFDEALPERRFDNLHFMAFDDIMRTYDGSMVKFAQEALRETPAQYRTVQQMGMLKKKSYKGAKGKHNKY